MSEVVDTSNLSSESPHQGIPNKKMALPVTGRIKPDSSSLIAFLRAARNLVGGHVKGTSAVRERNPETICVTQSTLQTQKERKGMPKLFVSYCRSQLGLHDEQK